MNIALLSNFTKHMKEATNITVLGFAKELKKRGHNPLIIAEGRANLKRYEEFQGIQVYRSYNLEKAGFINRILPYPLNIRKLRKKGIEFDIIHSFSSSPILVLRSVISGFFSKKSIIVHSIKSYSWKRWGDRFYWLLNFADMVTVQSKIVARKLEKSGCNPDKVKIINSHINTKKFRPMDKKALKKKYGYDKKIVLSYGAMRKEKGTDNLLKAVPMIVKKHPDSVFIFLCRFRYNGKYDDLIKGLGIERYVKIISKDVDIVEYVNMADILALPYTTMVATESNPSCLLEAMACKTSVVVSDLAELKEIVKDKKDVLMVKPGNVASLAEKMVILLSDDKLRKRLAENAFSKSKKFDVGRITDQFVKQYKKLQKKADLNTNQTAIYP